MKRLRSIEDGESSSMKDHSNKIRSAGMEEPEKENSRKPVPSKGEIDEKSEPPTKGQEGLEDQGEGNPEEETPEPPEPTMKTPQEMAMSPQELLKNGTPEPGAGGEAGHTGAANPDALEASGEAGDNVDQNVLKEMGATKSAGDLFAEAFDALLNPGKSSPSMTDQSKQIKSAGEKVLMSRLGKFKATFVEHEQAGEPKRRVIIEADDASEAERKAREIARKDGMTLVDIEPVSQFLSRLGSEEEPEGLAYYYKGFGIGHQDGKYAVWNKDFKIVYFGDSEKDCRHWIDMGGKGVLSRFGIGSDVDTLVRMIRGQLEDIDVRVEEIWMHAQPEDAFKRLKAISNALGSVLSRS